MITGYFQIVGEIHEPQTFAQGSGIRELPRLRKKYGPASWRKRKGVARVKLLDGSEHTAEIHWYEASGLGKFEFKIKRYLD